ncbi:MAG: branched-chain amino acid ABC transporter permease [Chloroflexi bacterium]|nr:branched-chain amino acid ABC transporter permease [Chloroflexota bacterium]
MTGAAALQRWWPWVPLLVLVLLPVGIRETFYLDLLMTTFMYAAITLGWDIMGGYAGYVSLGTVGFYGLGSYAGALLLLRFNIPVFVSAPFIGVLCSLVGAGLGWIALRTRAAAFVIVTLTFTSIVQLLALNLKGLTNGSSGLYMPLLTLPNNLILLPFYYYMLALLVFAYFVSRAIRGSKFGLGLIAIREEEEKAEGLGVDTSLYKILAFAISVFFACVAGALRAQYLNYVDPDIAFDLFITLSPIVMALVGGRGTLIGPLLGAFLVQPLSQYLVFLLPSSVAGQLHLVALGVVLLLVVLFMPDGIVNAYRSARAGGSGWRGRRQTAPPAEAAP